MNALEMHNFFYFFLFLYPKYTEEIHLTLVFKRSKSSRIHLFVTIEYLLSDLEFSFNFNNKT